MEWYSNVLKPFPEMLKEERGRKRERERDRRRE